MCRENSGSRTPCAVNDKILEVTSPCPGSVRAQNKGIPGPLCQDVGLTEGQPGLFSSRSWSGGKWMSINLYRGETKETDKKYNPCISCEYYSHQVCFTLPHRVLLNTICPPNILLQVSHVEYGKQSIWFGINVYFCHSVCWPGMRETPPMA